MKILGRTAPLLLMALRLVAQIPVTGRPVPQLDSIFDPLIQQIMTTWSIPGAALAITRDGRLVFAHGYGYQDPAGDLVRPNSLFRVASDSKPFTAAAILKLIEQGKLELGTTPFNTVLSNLTPPPGATEDPRINQITIQNLLEHKGGWDDTLPGVPDPAFAYVDIAAQTFNATPPATPALLIRYMLGQPLQHDPGTTYAYSNFGYIVLGQVIEQVSGQPYEAFVRQYILTPARIAHMESGSSLLTGRAPGEVTYYDYPGAPLVGSVFPPLGTPVPEPYGGFSLEMMKANAGWIATTMDLLRYADTMNGQLQPSILESPPPGFVGYVPPFGNGWYWYFYGSLPGTNTIIHMDSGYQVSGHVSWSILFNTRSGSDISEPILGADAQVLTAVQSVSTWPSADLFPLYTGTTSAPAVFRPTNGTWYVLHNGTPITQQWGLPGDIPVPGDYDGDGITDFAVWRPASGTWYVIPSSSPNTPIVEQWGLPGDVPVPGDYDGDGITDFAVWRPSTGVWYVIPSSNPSLPFSQQWGLPGDIPVAGDFDGDGINDFAVWRPSEGMWYVVPSANPAASITQQWGLPGDVPLTGDFDCDGKADFAVWRPSNGTWYIIPSSNPTTPIFQQWGLPGDVPVPGYFDGDGKTDLAVWRPSTGTWYVIPSGNPSPPTIQQWGLPGDMPIVGVN